MWHEARKQERLIRGMIVDYRRRAERRRDFYEKIKADPTQFIQLYGRPCKIHLDPVVAAAGDSPAIMMPWQGDTTNLIDRFDVRAHLDHIPEIKVPDIPADELSQEERHCNYERYRILAQNSFLGISEDKFLHQLEIEEQYGVTLEEKEAQREKEKEKKSGGAAIGYSYTDTSEPTTSAGSNKVTNVTNKEEDSDEESDIELIDVDLSIDVNKVEPSQAHQLNAHGPSYGMAGCDFFSFLTGDADDAEHQKQLMREEREKAMFSGRKSRRERRAHRDKKLATRVLSPPSYAAPASQTARAASRSPSRSPSPLGPGPDSVVTFITSFGGDDDETAVNKAKTIDVRLRERSFATVVRESAPGKVRRSGSPAKHTSRIRRSITSSPRFSRSRSHRRSLSRSRSRSYGSRSKSRRRYSRSPYRSRSRSWSRNSPPKSYARNKPYQANAKSWEHQGRSRSRSRSHSKEARATTHTEGQKGSLPRYYGRRTQDKSSSELSLDSDSSGSESTTTDRKNVNVVGAHSNKNVLHNSGTSNKYAKSKRPSETISLKEKLRRKMQNQLTRQLRADKKAEAERLEREYQQQQERDEEMRELAIKLRRRQRERRHQRAKHSHSSQSDRSSVSSPRNSPEHPSPERERERSRSRSRPVKHVPVWANEEDLYSRNQRDDPFPDSMQSHRMDYPDNDLRTDNRRMRSREMEGGYSGRDRQEYRGYRRRDDFGDGRMPQQDSGYNYYSQRQQESSHRRGGRDDRTSRKLVDY